MNLRSTAVARRWVMCGLLTGLLVVWAVGLASGQSVHLRSSAEVDASAGDEVLLGQVATLEGFTDSQVEALAALPIVQAEAATQRVTLAQVRDAMRRAGVNLGRISLSGFAVCELGPYTHRDRHADATEPSHSMPTVAIPETPTALANDHADAQSVRGLIVARLHAALPQPADEVVVAFDDRDRDTLDRSTLGTRFTVEPIGDVRLGRMNVRVTCTAGFGDATTETIGVRIGWRTRIVTARRDLARHERFNENNVQLTEVTLERAVDGEIFDVDAVRGSAAAGPIRAGRPVRETDLGRPTLVKRGQAVTVLVRRGNFEMTTTAFAEHDAALNEPITLRNQSRRSRDTKTFRAVVTGPARVTIQPDTAPNPPLNPQLAHGG